MILEAKSLFGGELGPIDIKDISQSSQVNHANH
jgi:hypothetical protein